MHAPIAQLDRVTDYESVGRGFESLSAYQKIQIPMRVSGFFYTRGLERATPVRTLVYSTVRWTVESPVGESMDMGAQSAGL